MPTKGVLGNSATVAAFYSPPVRHRGVGTASLTPRWAGTLPPGITQLLCARSYLQRFAVTLGHPRCVWHRCLCRRAAREDGDAVKPRPQRTRALGPMSLQPAIE